MRPPLRLVLLLLLVAAAVAVGFLLLRPRPLEAAYGAAVALCPGPDLYGYTCDSDAAVAYVDATNDTDVFTLDAVVTLALPFPFTFYGTTYDEVQAGSNGNLQFNNGNVTYAHVCLDDGPAAAMGDMIAPYWTDLDLRFAGALQWEVVGEAPERIFVVEWDEVQPFGAAEGDALTFAVQLFEGSNDIVFLYEDATAATASNGAAATIGLQSEAQGVALQYGCDQTVVHDGSQIHFPHPPQPNDTLGLSAPRPSPPVYATPPPREPVARLLARLAAQGPSAVPALRTHWLGQDPPRLATWRWVDVTGSGRAQLLILWRATDGRPQAAYLALVALDGDRRPALLLDAPLGDRRAPFAQPTLIATADLTGDGLADAVIHDRQSGRTFVVTAAGGAVARLPLPQQCRGSVAVLDVAGSKLPQIVRDGCAQPGRVLVGWNGRGFAAETATPIP